MAYNQQIPSKCANGSSQGSSKQAVVLSGLAGQDAHSDAGLLTSLESQQTLGPWKTWPAPGYQELWVRHAEWLRSAVHGHTLVLNPGSPRECKRQNLLQVANHSLSQFWNTLTVFLLPNAHIPKVDRKYLPMEVSAVTAGLAHTQEHVTFT